MPSPSRWLGFSTVLLAAALLTATLASAQVEITPAFTIPTDAPAGWFHFDGNFDVAAGPDGRALLLWVESPSGDASSPHKRAVASRLFDPSGPTFAAVLREPMKSVLPRITASASQTSYLTTWATGTETSDRNEFLGRTLTPDGVPLSDATQVTDNFLSGFGVWSLAAAGRDTGHVIAWGLRNGVVRARRVANDGSFGVEIDVDRRLASDLAVANTADGGFVVAYGAPIFARGFTAAGAPKNDAVGLTNTSGDELLALAASPIDDVVVAVIREDQPSAADPYHVVLRRFTSAGTLLGDLVVLAEAPGFVSADAAFNPNGDLYVVWARTTEPLQAQAFHRNGTPVGPAVNVPPSVSTSWVRTARLANGDFVNVWREYSNLRADVVSLCVPGSSVCGDGAIDTLCERCDDGAGNSDTAPNACRTDCQPARCGDGAVDSGETCDDGNTTGCDGCSAECVVETGLGCGDGVPFPACGEACDDANTTDGDGCSSCSLERASGGGSPTTDCFTAWSIDNPANEPRYDKAGAIYGAQACTDGDSRCDFDGTTGTCTFHVQVCVNNTNLAACAPGTRLASWTLRSPSMNQASARPDLAAVRAALLGVVPGSIVGPSQQDACSPVAAVPVTLRGTPGDFHKTKVQLKTRAVIYDGRTDTDKLQLECRPPE